MRKGLMELVKSIKIPRCNLMIGIFFNYSSLTNGFNNWITKSRRDRRLKIRKKTAVQHLTVRNG